MKTKHLALAVCVVLLPVTVAVAAGGDEKAVRDADEQWSRVAAAKDLDKTVSFYTDGAVVLPPNQAAVTTKDGIRNLWKAFLDSLTDISWKTNRVETAKSGDMAYLIGTYEMAMKDGTKEVLTILPPARLRLIHENKTIHSGRLRCFTSGNVGVCCRRR